MAYGRWIANSILERLRFFFLFSFSFLLCFALLWLWLLEKMGRERKREDYCVAFCRALCNYIQCPLCVWDVCIYVCVGWWVCVDVCVWMCGMVDVCMCGLWFFCIYFIFIYDGIPLLLELYDFDL